MSSISGLVLFGHGARDPRWAETMIAIGQRVRELIPGVELELAYLEFLQPSLAQAVDALVARGVRSIAVAPMFLAAGGHVLRDLPEQLAGLASKYQDVEIRVGQALGTVPTVIDAMARASAEMLDSAAL